MSKNAALAIAAALCVAAAGVGGYLAVRTSVATPAPQESMAARQDPVGDPAVPSGEYAGTEGVISEPAGLLDSASAGPSGADARRADLPAEAEPASAVVPAREPAPRPEPAVRRQPTPAVTPSSSPAPPVEAPPVAEPPIVEPPAVEAPPSDPPVTAAVPPVVGSTPAAESLPLPPPEPEFEELVVSSDSVLGLQLLTTVTTESAKVEDEVEARVTREVRVGDRVAIPVGARMLGSVTLVERGGKMKDRAKVGVRFHTLVLADSTRLPVQTEAIYREGASAGKESAAKVGAAAAGGAILGAILGGGKGAAIGGAVGAAGGTAAVMAGGRNPAVLASGTAVTVRLQQPVTVTVAR